MYSFVAMLKPFPDRTGALFGRDVDLAFLEERAELKGITAVVGRAQMGKSWLLKEAARRLSLDPHKHLVGFTEAAEPTDLFRQAAADLYARWLSDSSLSQQAQMILKQQQKDIVGKAGTVVGTIFESLSKAIGAPGEALGSLVKEAFNGMASINRELVSGSINVPPLQGEETREILEAVYRISKHPMVLVFDQWEKSPAMDAEASILDAFRRHLDEWPPCHIMIGTQFGGRVNRILSELKDSAPPGWVKVYELPPMHLQDESMQGALLRFIRDRVPAAAGAADWDLLDMIAGYPGTVYKWTASYNSQKSSLPDLKGLADDANKYRFREFDELLPQLSDAERSLAMRLSLVASANNEDNWKSLRSTILDGIRSSTLDGLRSRQILEEVRPPTYGHAKRREAAIQWFKRNTGEEFIEESESLIKGLAIHITRLTSEELPFAAALASLAIPELQLSDEALALWQIGRSLYGLEQIESDLLLRGVRIVRKTKDLAATAAPFGIGLANAIILAKQAEALERRDALLDELRLLASTFPDDAAVRESLACGLFGTINHATQEKALERRNMLFDKLRQLAAAYPDDAAVREQFAMGLYNMVVYAKQELALKRRDMLLDELRQLAAAYPLDAAVRKQFAMGLSSTILHAKQEEALERRDMLLDELRELAAAHPDDAAVRKSFAMGLFNTAIQAKLEDALERRNMLFDELRHLAAAFPNDVAVRERFAKGLCNVIRHVRQEKDLERQHKLLDELIRIATAYPGDAAVQNSITQLFGGQVRFGHAD